MPHASSTADLNYTNCRWLPTSRHEIEALGWTQPDIIIFTADAYVDHPSFGAAVIGRVLEADGFCVAIVPQPNWRDDLRDFVKLGAPRLFFGISGGCMDSMVNHYTAGRRLRSDDAYTPGNRAGFRPDYAVTVYARILKHLYPSVPLIIGGIEASLRRFTHYDYWQDKLMPSILSESKADLLVYGMGEHTIRTVARKLQNGKKISEIIDLPQTAFISQNMPPPIAGTADVILHAHESCVRNKKMFAENFCRIETESNKRHAARIIEPVGKNFVTANPPEHRVDEVDNDLAFDLPYTRMPHPRYRGKTIPASEMIRFSINIHRGCFGGCSFCTISAHQGKFIASRSERSILSELRQVTQMPGFAGHISDLGGPSANMYGMKGQNAEMCNGCHRYSCLHPKLCKNLNTAPTALRSLYEKARNMDGVKKISISSGIRYDLFMDERGFLGSNHACYFSELLQHHVSGRLKVAPEHCVPHVLQAMRKPPFTLFVKLNEEFNRINTRHNLRQQIIPYFISGHPGCTEADMRQIKNATQRLHFNQLEQVQDFTPTPMTLASVMFYCGFDPYTGIRIPVARCRSDKQKQKEYFFSRPT